MQRLCEIFKGSEENIHSDQRYDRERTGQPVKSPSDCGGGGCGNCSFCWPDGRNPWEIYQDYIERTREISEIDMEYYKRCLHGRFVK